MPVLVARTAHMSWSWRQAATHSSSVMSPSLLWSTCENRASALSTPRLGGGHFQITSRGWSVFYSPRVQSLQDVELAKCLDYLLQLRILLFIYWVDINQIYQTLEDYASLQTVGPRPVQQLEDPLESPDDDITLGDVLHQELSPQDAAALVLVKCLKACHVCLYLSKPR